jgi:hypothetical protein
MHNHISNCSGGNNSPGVESELQSEETAPVRDHLQCAFGSLLGKRCPNDATWLTTLDGVSTGDGWCDEHKLNHAGSRFESVFIGKDEVSAFDMPDDLQRGDTHNGRQFSRFDYRERRSLPIE